MATIAGVRVSSLASTSYQHSCAGCRNGQQIIVSLSRPPLRLCCSPRFPRPAARFSSLCSFSHSPSISKLLRSVPTRGPLVSVVSSSPRCEAETNTDGKTPFGYTRKDVILIGLGLLGFGFGLKYGLELFGVDSIKAGNAVQLTMVFGLTVGWISTYVFRVSSKEMTYAKQLRDYENRVMQKRLEELPEAELESMLAQVEEEKKILRENGPKPL